MATSRFDERVYTVKLERLPLLGVYLMLEPGLQITLKPASSKPRYFVPKGLGKNLLGEYEKTMDWLLRYRDTVGKQPKIANLKYLIEPLAMSAEVSMSGPRDKLVAAAMGLTGCSVLEIKKSGVSLLSGLGVSGTSTGSANHVLSNDIAANVPSEREPARLVSTDHHNEFAVLADYLYARSGISMRQLREQVDNLKYDQKQALLLEVLRLEEKTHASVPLEHYQFELIVTPTDLITIGSEQYLDAAYAQPAVPYFGYAIPQDLSSKFTDVFERAFDMSYKLYSLLQNEADAQIAQLAVLSGHRQRFIVRASSQQLALLAKDSSHLPAAARHLVSSMIDCLTVVHPLRTAYYREAAKLNITPKPAKTARSK